jgi:hypothetical protein
MKRKSGKGLREIEKEGAEGTGYFIDYFIAFQ